MLFEDGLFVGGSDKKTDSRLTLIALGNTQGDKKNIRTEDINSPNQGLDWQALR